MAHYREDIIDVELESGTINRTFMAHAIGKADIMANRFGVRLLRGGAPAVIDGTCQGYFMAPNGSNIAITGSSYTGVDHNVAWVQLPQACYNVEGQFTLAIKIVGSTVTGTMRIIDGVVSNTGVDGAVAPTASVPTYSEIIALYDEMQTATAAAEAVAEDITETNAANLWTVGDLDIPAETGYINLSSLGRSLELPAGTYTISANAKSEHTDNKVRMLWKVNNVNTYVDLTSSTTRSKKTFTFSSAGTLIRLQSANEVASAPGYGGYLHNVQITAGSSDPAYRPFETAVDQVLRIPMVFPSGTNDWNTDSRAIYSAYSNSRGLVKLAEGEYHINVLGIGGGNSMPVTIEGSGKNTIIYVNAEANYGYGIRISDNCAIRNLTLRASDYESYTPADLYTAGSVKHGIRIAPSTDDSLTHAVIENVSIEGFSGAGILIDATGQGTSDGCHVLNCWMDNCGAGIWMNTHAEFNRIECCNVSTCWYGIICDGGNNSIVNCGLSKNKYGFYLNNSGNNLGNNSHSQVIGCIFNHEDYDTTTLGKGWGIYVDHCTSGLQFVGCNMFYAGIYIKNSHAVCISNFNFGKMRESGEDVGVKIQFVHDDSTTYSNMMTSCYFDKAPRLTVPQNDSKFKFYIRDCYTRQGTAITA